MAGQERREVLADADGAHAGTAAAVGDAEGLVEVEVADVGAELAGVDEADLGVEVRAVHVDLAAVGVDDLADLADLFFEDAVGGGVGDHDAGEDVRVLGGLFAEVFDVDVALLVAADADDFHGGHRAEAGLVPCAEAGMRQMLRWPSPRLRW